MPRVQQASQRDSRPHARVPIDTERLRQLRRAKGLTQHELSLKVGVQGAAAVSAWERGVSVPHPSKIPTLAKLLGVDPTELLPEGTPLGFRELRVIRGLSRSALASAASTSITTIRRWEGGDFRFLPDEALRRSVAKALGVSLAQLTRSLEVSRASQDRA